MKFKEFLKLNEDEGGGDFAGDDVTPPASNTSNMDHVSYPVGFFARNKMPQIDATLFSHFTADLKNRGIGYKKSKLKSGNLTPSQSEFNDDKVGAIKKSRTDGTYKTQPILVSNDSIIIDGHHRWKAFDTDEYIDATVIDLPFTDAFDFLQNKPYAINRTINEKQD